MLDRELDVVPTLGADEVLDHTVDDFADGSRRFDLIVDLAGNPSVSRLRRALTSTGTAVIAGGEGNGDLVGMRRQLRALLLSPLVRPRFVLCVIRLRAADLERLTALIEAGSIIPALDRTYPLAETADAMRRLVAGEVRGKVAITVRTV